MATRQQVMDISTHRGRGPRGAGMQLLGEVKILSEDAVLGPCEASPSATSTRLELEVGIELINQPSTSIFAQ